MRFLRIAAALAFVLTVAPAGAQQKSLREQIVGSWNFVVAEVVAPDGKKSFPFGETPTGILIFTAGGQFAQIHVASDVPKLASNNRLTGTPEEYATIMRRTISLFGTYTVNEEKKTVTYQYRVEHISELRRRGAGAHHRQADRRRIHQHESKCGRRARPRHQYLQKRKVRTEPDVEAARRLQPFRRTLVCPGTIGRGGVALAMGPRL